MKKKKESEVKAVAWTLPSEDKKISFCMQINGITKKNKKKIIKSLAGWRLSGEGFNYKTKKEIVICHREFATQGKFKKWAKSFPYAVFQQNEKTAKLKKMNKVG